MEGQPVIEFFKVAFEGKPPENLEVMASLFAPAVCSQTGFRKYQLSQKGRFEMTIK